MYEKELEAALDAVAHAGKVVLEHYERFEVVPDAPASISTAADREAQETILNRLRRVFPDDAYCAEESTAGLTNIPRSGPRLWIIDPVDGTRGFARKNGEFSLMVGFVHEGRIAVGAVFEPVPDRLTYASLGRGCWCQVQSQAPVKCQVSNVSDLNMATLTRSRSKRSSATQLRMDAMQPARVIETYSAGIKLALVARGEADIYLNTYSGVS
ncbi:MAG: hypothetical protein KatS3mg105_2640 [Gemmatales bacterium]|nr:MAG: hypothetical protein KatS3mg105_2640 [Gemmatales bacterium]